MPSEVRRCRGPSAVGERRDSHATADPRRRGDRLAAVHVPRAVERRARGRRRAPICTRSASSRTRRSPGGGRSCRRPRCGLRRAALPALRCRRSATGSRPTLDRFFERALAKRPEDRPATALELAAALRVAAGPRQRPRRSAEARRRRCATRWLADAPQPLAEAVAAARRRAQRCTRRATPRAISFAASLRYLLALALAARAQVRDDRDEPGAARAAARAAPPRARRRRARIELLRLLVRPFDEHAAAPIRCPSSSISSRPADDNDASIRSSTLRPTSDRRSEDVVRSQLAQLVPDADAAAAHVRRSCSTTCSWCRATGVAERWTGPAPARGA